MIGNNMKNLLNTSIRLYLYKMYCEIQSNDPDKKVDYSLMAQRNKEIMQERTNDAGNELMDSLVLTIRARIRQEEEQFEIAMNNLCLSLGTGDIYKEELEAIRDRFGFEDGDYEILTQVVSLATSNNETRKKLEDTIKERLA